MKAVLVLFLIFSLTVSGQSKIDRKAVVNRHNVHIKEVDTLNSLTLGNGTFAMTMDVTGLQTFPVHYHKGIPLGTMSEWGWHSFPSDDNYTIDETLKTLDSHGREVPYAIQWPDTTRAGKASDYIRQNPHRIHLANVGWYIKKKDGSIITINDIKNIDQKLDVWNGELISTFEIEGVPVEVISLVSQHDDILGVKIKSELVKEGRIGLNIKFPYPTDNFLDEAANYDPDEPGRLKVNKTDQNNISIQRKLDSTKYDVNLSSSLKLTTTPTNKGFIIEPKVKNDTWTFLCHFSNTPGSKIPPNNFTKLREQTTASLNNFWNSGGMIDFGETEDPRALELERRMILSLYLTKINCGGSTPPQETGLTYNSWYGKPHMEMIWWHGVHFPLWGRPEILEKQMEWYLRNSKIAREIAKRQGFKGVRWQKMTDPDGGETSSSIGSYLIWQQPHFIYFSELLYHVQPEKTNLEKYYPLIEQTADFMADFAWYDPELKRYILGPGIIAAQERFDPKITFNPTYELAYWHWGLETAQKWRGLLGMDRNKEWDKVLNGLSPLPQKDSLYLATESTPDSYSTQKFMTDHPSVLGTYGMLPETKNLDKEIMRATLNKIWEDWHWEETWGWDFPMTAMTATRLNDPEKAVNALLMPITTNTYLKNGHNYQTERLRLYLPGNGGLLTALAMMAVGTQETEQPKPCFPGNWKIKVEGLNKIP